MRDWNVMDLRDIDVAPPAGTALAGPVALGSTRGSNSRRTVLQAMGLSAATIGWLAVGWTLPGGQRKAFADSSAGLSGYTKSDCKDAYPSGYAQQGTNDGSGYPAACFGGTYRGPQWCASTKWVRQEHTQVHNGNDYYTANKTSCAGKNAWRWTVSGHVYRCSDGYWKYDRIGTTYGPYFVICQGKLS